MRLSLCGSGHSEGTGPQILTIAVKSSPQPDSTGGFFRDLTKVFGRSPKFDRSIEQAAIDPALTKIGVVTLANYARGTTPSLGRRNLAQLDNVHEQERVETGPEGSLSNRVFEDYDAIIEAGCQAWNKLINQPQTIMSIGSREWAHKGR